MLKCLWVVKFKLIKVCDKYYQVLPLVLNEVQSGVV